MTKAEIKRLKDATAALTKWNSSGKAFGHLRDLNSITRLSKKSDRIFEFYCVLRIIKDLRYNYKTSIKPNSNGLKIFPQSPAPKSGYALFKIENKVDTNNKYQICYGTKIKISSSPKTTIAADISFQKHNASDDPDESEVILIMDVKFKEDESKKLSISTIREFAQCVTDLKVKKASTTKIVFKNLKALKGNCLLTNGDVIAEHRQYCVNNHIKQIGAFDFDGRKIVTAG